MATTPQRGQDILLVQRGEKGSGTCSFIWGAGDEVAGSGAVGCALSLFCSDVCAKGDAGGSRRRNGSAHSAHASQHSTTCIGLLEERFAACTRKL